MMRSFYRCIVIAIVVLCLLALGGAGVALAAEPWWHLNTVSAPASLPGSEGRVIVEVSNLGDGMVKGAGDPVTVVDRLPEGVTPTHVYGEGGGGQDIAGAIGSNHREHCSIAGQTVTCTYAGALLPYERLMIAVSVNVASGAGTGENEAEVSGGAAAPVVLRRALALSESVPSYGVENYEITPEEEGGAVDTQAGSHPFQLTTTVTFNTLAVPISSIWYKEILPEVQPLAYTKDLRFNIPPGLIGNPVPLPKCSMYVFLERKCPDDATIGVATPIVINPDDSAHVPYAVSEPLYSLEPSVGEPARFGFETYFGPVILDTSVRTGGDYGVVITVPSIPEVGFIGNQVTFWGVPNDSRHDTSRGENCLTKFEEEAGGSGVEPKPRELSCPVQEKAQPFLIMPTSCTGSLHTTMESDSWEEPGQFTAFKEYTFANLAGEPYGLDGCNRLSFEPSIDVAPDGQQGSTPTGLTVGVHVAQEASLNPAGLAESAVKDTTVVLPAGVGLNPAGADGLSACSIGEIGLESPGEQECPESSKVGTVEIKSPLIPNPLVGAAYLAQQNANPFGSLVALYLVAYDPVSGVRVKVAGEVKPDPVTGQLVSTFKETPQLPFEELSLHFFGGSRAPLGTPALCGGYATTAAIAPWSGNEPVDSSSEFKITSGPNGSPCSNPLPFNPSLTTGSLNIQAGAFTPVYDDDEPRRRQPESRCDPVEDASRPAWDSLLGQVVRGRGRQTRVRVVLKA